MSMRARLPPQLLAIARRVSADAAAADDLVQEALLVGVSAGRIDLGDPATVRWLAGIVRNRARMGARTGVRRRRRESEWQREQETGAPPADGASAALLADLAPSLRVVAALALSGHSRREIGWLLRLPDTALRQRISQLRRIYRRRGVAAPEGLPGLGPGLAYGRIRAALPPLLAQGGMFATHDPDGHLFVVRSSQTGMPRQQGTQQLKGSTST